MLTAASLLKLNRLRTQRGAAFRLCSSGCDSIKAIFSGVITGKKLQTAAFNYKQWKERIIYALLPLLSPFTGETKGCVKLLFKVMQASRAVLSPITSAEKSNVNLALGCLGSELH